MKHKLIVFLFTLLMSFGIFIPLIPTKVNAVDGLTYLEEYKLWRSYKVVESCLGQEVPLGEDRLSSKQSVANSFFDDSLSTDDSDSFNKRPGDYYLEEVIGLNSNKLDCNTIEDIEPVVDALGFNGLFGFADSVKRNIESSGNDNYTKEAIVAGLRQRIQDQGARLGLDQNLDFQYWYANQIFKYECNGVFADSRDDNNTSGTFYVVNDSGNIETFKYANFGYESDRTIEGIDEYMTVAFNDRAPTCRNIANWHTEERAKAYADRFKSLSESTQAAIVSENSDTNGQGQQSCEEASNTPVAWIACPLIGFVNDIVNWLFDFADSLLNIEAQQLYNDAGLRTAWSYFRVIATLALLIIGLVMVISQIAGGTG